MASTVTELMMRRMGAKSGSAIDWESIARGMLDYTTPFEIPEGVEVTPNQSVMQKRTNLTGVVKIKSDATTIGNAAFQDTSITGVIFPNTLTSIVNDAFGKAKIEGDVIIPDSVQTIGNNVFQLNKGITKVTLGSSLTSIGVFAFQSCDHLVDVVCKATTPPTISAQYTFQGCSALANIYVPDASVSTYQSASGWSSFASLIKPISQRPT